MQDDARPLLRVVAAEPEGWDRPVRQAPVHVLFTDGTWRTATVNGWRRNKRGWVVCLTWPGGRSSWHIYDRRYIHPV